VDYQGYYKDTGVELDKDMYENAGLDVHSSENAVVPARGDVIIHTNLFIQIPVGCVGLLWSRSGMSVKAKIETGAGCIDSNYRGEVKVHLYNLGDEDYHVKAGDKITQLLTIPCVLNPYKKVKDLNESDRGNKGFGSSGR
jgi:dUTP pyrophosphatase